ncbi:MAG: glycosyltransferase [Pseudomonadota bacterium]
MRLEAELRARGHDVTFVTGTFDHARKAQIDRDLLPHGKGITVLRLPSYQKNVGLARIWCHFVCAIKIWFAAIGTRWDVVITSSIPPEALVAARLLRKRALVLDIRDIWPDALQAYGKPSTVARLFGAYCDFLFRRTLKHARRIMIVAPGYRRWLERYGALQHGRVKFVPLGFRREDFLPLSQANSDYTFCYAGGATPQFDIREFVPEFGDKDGVVLGSGPLLEDWKAAFPKAEFRGAVPREEAMETMARSARLLFPSNPFAQLPNKSFDYFALGHRVAFGENCTRATRSLLALRHRREANRPGTWEDYRALEKEAIAQRAADIVEGAAG